jgi:multicomponent Na+:H+ antiporter subunit E
MTLMKIKISWSTIIFRGVLFSLFWHILTNGDTSSWWIGAPAVLLAVTTSTALLPPMPLAWYEFARFVPFFLIRSLLGGADVARSAFHPRMPIVPDLIDYPMKLSPGLPQVFMAYTINLLPGTLSAELEANCLKVHVLDRRKDVLAELEAVEQHVARMFDVSLGNTGGN